MPRAQRRKKRNKSLKKLKPHSEPKAFGGLCTMDHWSALDYLSRGLYGETSCVTLRDRFARFLAAKSTFGKSAERVTDFLVNLRAHHEQFVHIRIRPES
eukprot:9476695-Pyramimonas_sp.AAC.1